MGPYRVVRNRLVAVAHQGKKIEPRCYSPTHFVSGQRTFRHKGIGTISGNGRHLHGQLGNRKNHQ